MPSYLRLNLHAPLHRRYELAFDSSFRVSRQLEPRQNPDEAEEIYYYVSYIYYNTSRPKHPRMELRLQMTYLVSTQVTTGRLHILHILLIFQIVAQLVETGTMQSNSPIGRTNPYYPALPILRTKKSFNRHFDGPTLFHFTIQSFIRCLQSTRYRELGV